MVLRAEPASFMRRRRRLSRLGFVAVLLCLGAVTASPGEAYALSWSPFDLSKVEQATIKSASGAEYRIIVSSPSGPPPAKGYPVIYVVDGNAFTVLVSEIIRTNLKLGMNSRTEPAVAVGIGYPIADAWDKDRRAFDLTPKTVNPADINSVTDGSVTTAKAGGDVALMDFISDVVKPVIEARFQVDNQRQTLVGHSLGGLFVLRSLFTKPASFQTYVALSPSLWWNNGSEFAEAKKFLRTYRPTRDLRVFISSGDLEQNWTPLYRRKMRSIINLRAQDKGVALSGAEVKDRGG